MSVLDTLPTAPLRGAFHTVRDAARSTLDFAANVFDPTLRIGVTGLSRAGKTVFITALVHNLTKGGRLTGLRAAAEGRVREVTLSPQPDDAVPRFAYEDHRDALSGADRTWPESTRRISQLRLVLDYEVAGPFGTSRRRLNLDIVDYPGEWLLDLPLLSMSYAEWSRKALDLADGPTRAPLAIQWRAHAATLDPQAPAREEDARRAAELFTQYLRACRDEKVSLSMLPPGRFLMPGDLEGSPALTFAPLDVADDAAPAGSLHAMMARRYEAYKAVVVRPFYAEHFARLDRQIVLVDILQALNAGPRALADLEGALSDILAAFRPGANSILSRLFAPRIDRVVLGATKADHLHHGDHDRLEAMLAWLARGAIGRARERGAEVDTVALASVRATREGTVSRDGESLPVIIGTPREGERIGARRFDGETETAVFPGSLPSDPEAVLEAGYRFSGEEEEDAATGDFRFVRFRPPERERGAALPHIRLDRALERLIGDRLT
ncbi:MAG: YcjX family protein [Pseudomonadota bacterium]